MKHKVSQFKLFRALGLKEWGYDDEAYTLVTEIIYDEVEDNVPNARKVTKNGKRQFQTPAKVEQVAADQGSSRTPRHITQQQQGYWPDERRSWRETY